MKKKLNNKQKKKLKIMRQLKASMKEHKHIISDLNWKTLRAHDIGIQELNAFLKHGKYPD